jgi:hypothetical protein
MKPRPCFWTKSKIKLMANCQHRVVKIQKRQTWQQTRHARCWIEDPATVKHWNCGYNWHYLLCHVFGWIKSHQSWAEACCFCRDMTDLQSWQLTVEIESQYVTEILNVETINWTFSGSHIQKNFYCCPLFQWGQTSVKKVMIKLSKILSIYITEVILTDTQIIQSPNDMND